MNLWASIIGAMMLITLTKDMIEAGIINNGGYSKAQMMALGVGWPPDRGWKQKFIGMQIDDSAYRRFLSLAESSRKKKRLLGKRQSRKKSRIEKQIESDNFLTSFAWRKLRYQALNQYGKKCACCGATPESGAVLHVDHIKPRKKYPQLALDINNLQILCGECNHGKGNWDETDHRQQGK